MDHTTGRACAQNKSILYVCDAVLLRLCSQNLVHNQEYSIYETKMGHAETPIFGICFLCLIFLIEMGLLICTLPRSGNKPCQLARRVSDGISHMERWNSLT